MNAQSGWQLSGGGPEAYERFISEPMTEPCVPALFDAVQLTAGDRVLDLGCGTGIVARMAAGRVGSDGRIVGMDLNPGMLAAAQELAGDGAAANVEWRQGDAMNLPVEDGAFDVVFCQQALQFVPDKIAAVREMHRVLDSEGRVACSVLRDLSFNPFQQAIAAALERHIGPDAAQAIHMAFGSGDPDALRELGTEAGFHRVQVQPQMTMIRYDSLDEMVPGYLASTPASGLVADAGASVQSAVLEDVEDALHDYLDDDGLAAPFQLYVLTGRKSAAPLAGRTLP